MEAQSVFCILIEAETELFTSLELRRKNIEKLPRREAQAADFPRDVCLTASHGHKVSFYPVQTNISWNNDSDALKWYIIRFHK